MQTYCQYLTPGFACRYIFKHSKSKHKEKSENNVFDLTHKTVNKHTFLILNQNSSMRLLVFHKYHTTTFLVIPAMCGLRREYTDNNKLH